MSGNTGTSGTRNAALHVGLGAAQDDHADVDEHEREQRADVDELGDLAQRDEGGEQREQDAEDQR